jgi:adenosine kinase
MQIFISGSLAYDRIMDFPERFSDHILPDKIHVLNVCFMVNGMHEEFGGTAGNIAYNLALLGERPLILASAGKDFDSYAEWLTSHGLSLEGIRCVPNEFTAGAYITTDKADNQITGFNPGAMKYACGYEIDGIRPEDALAIVAPGNLDDMRTYSGAFKERNIPYIFDPGQSIPAQSVEGLIEMITGSAVLISNDYELELIMRFTGLSRSALLELTGAILTTLGDRGSRVVTSNREEEIPAVQASQVLDPTGAGDAYRAGLIKGMVMGKSLPECARMGAVCASYGVQCRGTQCHSFSQKDFWARYEAHFGPLT